MNELDLFRCQVRAVNIEYSAFVRRRNEDEALARMAKLRAERSVLMALIAVERQAAATQRALEQILPNPLRLALHREVAIHARNHPVPIAGLYVP